MNLNLTNKTYTTNKTYMTYPKSHKSYELPPHGGYRSLKSYQTTLVIYDLSVLFVRSYIPMGSRTRDQMEQAARSGKQNIAEGSMASATSKKTELKLIGVARASLEELLQDYEDFLRQRGLRHWGKDDPRAAAIRALAYKSDRSYTTYKSYLTQPEAAANCLVCLINQANYLLDRQIASLMESFVKEGGFSENLFKKRLEVLKRVSNPKS